MSVTGSWEPPWVRGVLGSEREVEVAAGIGLVLVAVWGVCERGRSPAWMPAKLGMDEAGAATR